MNLPTRPWWRRSETTSRVLPEIREYAKGQALYYGEECLKYIRKAVAGDDEVGPAYVAFAWSKAEEAGAWANVALGPLNAEVAGPLGSHACRPAVDSAGDAQRRGGPGRADASTDTAITKKAARVCERFLADYDDDYVRDYVAQQPTSLMAMVVQLQRALNANVSAATRNDSVVSEDVTLPVGEKPASDWEPSGKCQYANCDGTRFDWDSTDSRYGSWFCVKCGGMQLPPAALLELKRIALTDMADGLERYVFDHGDDHDDDCPCDDTCDCSQKPVNDAVNSACRLIRAMAIGSSPQRT